MLTVCARSVFVLLYCTRALLFVNKIPLHIRIRLRRHTHALLVEFKALLKLKSGNVLACYLLTSSGNASSSRQDSQIEESIAGRCMKVKLSVHGASNKLYMVFCVCTLLTHYIYTVSVENFKV